MICRYGAGARRPPPRRRRPRDLSTVPTADPARSGGWFADCFATSPGIESASMRLWGLLYLLARLAQAPLLNAHCSSGRCVCWHQQLSPCVCNFRFSACISRSRTRAKLDDPDAKAATGAAVGSDKSASDRTVGFQHAATLASMRSFDSKVDRCAVPNSKNRDTNSPMIHNVSGAPVCNTFATTQEARAPPAVPCAPGNCSVRILFLKLFFLIFRWSSAGPPKNYSSQWSRRTCTHLQRHALTNVFHMSPATPGRTCRAIFSCTARLLPRQSIRALLR
eukprot:SAG31_NODE_895_length_11169_cov_3.114182_5_plen_278_part_00